MKRIVLGELERLEGREVRERRKNLREVSTH